MTWLAGLLVTAAAAATTAPLPEDAVIEAAERAPIAGFAQTMGWNDPYAPFTVFANIHYVGTRTVSAWLITDPKGHVLIDGVVPQSAPLIARNIETLGFRLQDVRYLLNSHAHVDHAGGLAGLKRRTGAIMVASAADRPFLEAGDIGHGPSKGEKFPPVHVDRVIADGETVRIGHTLLTAHLTPGHSPGCTSWSMQARGRDGQLRDVFFHCSATVAGQSLHPEAYPGIQDNFRALFPKVAAMKADIFLANHDSFFGLHAKRQRLEAGDANAFVDPGELARFNAAMEHAFGAELARQKSPQGSEK